MKSIMENNLDKYDFNENTYKINVDVDNTLTKGDKRYWEVNLCDPDQEMIEWVNKKYCEGHTIIIWTARPWKNAPQLKAFLTRYQVRHHGIMMGKGSGDMYIDDKAVNVEEVKTGTSISRVNPEYRDLAAHEIVDKVSEKSSVENNSDTVNESGDCSTCQEFNQ